MVSVNRPGIGAALIYLTGACCNATAAEPLLHRPSPDWRDQIIYFALTDRFDDGEPGNNDQGAGEYDPKNPAKYSGGDLRGLARRVDYLRELGATALWITPPVANQWWDGRIQYGGYHGYWAENFMAVDSHYGTLADYRNLSDALHRKRMYLVQDIVVNHTGNFFGYAGAWDGAHPERNFSPNTESRPVSAPSLWPFSQNDARDAKQRAAGFYHWTPVIADFAEPRQEQDFQLSELDDLNTENPVVRRALREAYGYWIREVGVDAFRVDTAFYVPPEFFADFLYSTDAKAPGIMRVAEQTGRRGFHAFGEGFAVDAPYAEAGAKKIERYVRGEKGERRLPAMINFPLYGSLGEVFARGRPTAVLAHRIESTLRVHENPHLMPSFVDNHDVDRFGAGGSEAGLKQALLAILTLPGIPTIYYGTEQGLRESRPAMFAAGYGSGGRDRFDAGAPLYRFLQAAIRLRRDNPVFSRGTPRVLASLAAGPGALAYRMDHGRDAALVVFNSADRETLMDGVATGWPAGTVLAGRYALDGKARDLVVGEGGRVSLRLPPRAGLVWLATARRAEPPAAAASLRVQPLAAAPYGGDFTVAGEARGVARLQLVVDGDLAAAQAVRPGPDGRWQARLRSDDWVDPDLAHRLVAWSDSPWAVSPAASFRVARQWTQLAELVDPAGDDAGPAGRYRYPTEASWQGRHPADIRRVRVYGSGGALRLEVEMAELLAAWNPVHGFDHLALTAFLELPGRTGGSPLMPLQHARLPDGMRWHYRWRVHGWSNALFAAEGADAGHEGRVTGPAAELRVDRATKTLSLILPAAPLGRPASLQGARLYLNAWDHDGGYKPLSPGASSGGFGGGDGRREPLIMDETAVLTLP